MTWEMVLTAMERAHPCNCGSSIERFDREHATDLKARVRAHLRGCPKYGMLVVLVATMSQLPPEPADEAGERASIPGADAKPGLAR